MGQIPQYYSREIPNVAPPKAPLISNQAASKVVDLVDHYERRKTMLTSRCRRLAIVE